MLKYSLLGLLSYKKLTGYELTKAFEDSICFFWNVTMSQVYRELGVMLKNKWLECDVIIQDGKPNKKNYSVTEEGRSQLMSWLRIYNGESFFITRNSFLVNLFFSGMKDIDENIKVLKKFRDDCVAYSKTLANTEQTIPDYAKNLTNKIDAVYWDIVADFGRSNMKETIRWVDRSIQRLEKLNENSSN